MDSGETLIPINDDIAGRLELGDKIWIPTKSHPLIPWNVIGRTLQTTGRWAYEILQSGLAGRFFVTQGDLVSWAAKIHEATYRRIELKRASDFFAQESSKILPDWKRAKAQFERDGHLKLFGQEIRFGDWVKLRNGVTAQVAGFKFGWEYSGGGELVIRKWASVNESSLPFSDAAGIEVAPRPVYPSPGESKQEEVRQYPLTPDECYSDPATHSLAKDIPDDAHLSLGELYRGAKKDQLADIQKTDTFETLKKIYPLAVNLDEAKPVSHIQWFASSLSGVLGRDKAKLQELITALQKEKAHAGS